jgi:hypothetical protein
LVDRGDCLRRKLKENELNIDRILGHIVLGSKFLGRKFSGRDLR